MAESRKFVVVLEPSETGFSACSPDLDGGVAAAVGREETIAPMQEAISFRL